MPTPTLEQSTQQLKYHLQQAAAIIDGLCHELDRQQQDYAYLQQQCKQLLWNYRQALACLAVHATPVAEPKKVVDLPPFLIKGGNANALFVKPPRIFRKASKSTKRIICG